MGNGIIALLSNIASAIGGWFGWAKDKQVLNNTEAMKANKTAQNDQTLIAEETKAVEEQNDEQIRKNLAD